MYDSIIHSNFMHDSDILLAAAADTLSGEYYDFIQRQKVAFVYTNIIGYGKEITQITTQHHTALISPGQLSLFVLIKYVDHHSRMQSRRGK